MITGYTKVNLASLQKHYKMENLHKRRTCHYCHKMPMVRNTN